jgi:hypothetical protein
MKICSVRAELFHADGQADRKKLMVTFHSLVKTPEIMIFTQDSHISRQL